MKYCGSWSVVFVTPTSGKLKPVCNFFTKGIGCWRDANQASGSKVQLPLPTLAPTPAAPSGVTFSSSNLELQAAWDFAVPMAMSYVMTGKDPAYVPCYLAGLLDRPAFYARDIAHHALGAAILGLDKENAAMMKIFAASATPARKYFPLWSFDFYGKIYPLDYISDNNYVRETPTPFDLLTAAGRLMQWTADPVYAADPVMWAAWSAFTEQFITLHSPNNDGVVGWSNPSGNIFAGAASYVENGEGLIFGADTLAKQSAAFSALASFHDFRGNSSGASTARARAAQLSTHFNDAWYNASLGGYYRGVRSQGSLQTPLFGWGETQSVFPGLHGMLQPGVRADAQIATILAHGPKAGTEARTYIPELLFLFGLPDAAASFISQLVADPRRNYPEVSFTLVADLAVHMMGLEPIFCGNASSAPLLSTLGGNLPSSTENATAQHVPVCGTYKLAVTQFQRANKKNGGNATELTLQVGVKPIIWEARFLGTFSHLFVNGLSTVASQGKTVSGLVFSSAKVQVENGVTVRVGTNQVETVQ